MGRKSAAAEKLRRAQPTVFAAVKTLEAQLGLTLLDRSSYRVALPRPAAYFMTVPARCSSRSECGDCPPSHGDDE